MKKSKSNNIIQTKHLVEELGIIGNYFKENKIENNSGIEKNKKSQNRLSEENKCDEIDKGKLKIVEQEISIINNDIEDFKVDTNKVKQDEFINKLQKEINAESSDSDIDYLEDQNKIQIPKLLELESLEKTNKKLPPVKNINTLNNDKNPFIQASKNIDYEIEEKNLIEAENNINYDNNPQNFFGKYLLYLIF